MPRVFISNTDGVFARAVADKVAERGCEVVALSEQGSALLDGVDALVICDLVPALMLSADPEAAKASLPDEVAIARIERLITAATEAGVSRIVAISATRAPHRAVPPEVAALSERLESLLSQSGANRTVVLRTAEVMDPKADGTIAMVRKLIRGEGFGAASGDATQGIAISDLAIAAAAATEVGKVGGRYLDVVSPVAVARGSFAQEAERLAQLLSDPSVTEVQARPDYPPATALVDAAPAAAALHVSPKETPWTILAKTVQEIVRRAAAEGRMPAVVPPMPEVYKALETGDLPLAGKTVVLNGATNSIGQQTAMMLVRLGADVTGIGRAAEAGADLAKDIDVQRPFWDRLRDRHARLACETGRVPELVVGEVGKFRFEQADVTDLESVKALAARLSGQMPRIDALIHAGLVSVPKRIETPQGIEISLLANLVAPVTLTRLLAGPLRKAGTSGGARVVNLVAEGHEAEPVNIDDLHSRWSYAPTTVLARQGSGQIMMTAALARAMAGTGVSAISVNAGNVRGGVGEDPTDKGDGKAANTRQRLEAQQRARRQTGQSPVLSPAETAAHLVDAVVSSEFSTATGGYLAGGEITEPAPHVADPAAIDALWRTCAEIAGLNP